MRGLSRILIDILLNIWQRRYQLFIQQARIFSGGRGKNRTYKVSYVTDLQSAAIPPIIAARP